MRDRRRPVARSRVGAGARVRGSPARGRADAIVFAAREMAAALHGLPELHVEPLGHRDARALLESVLPAPLDEQVLERLIVETGGNPLALMELPRGLTSSELAGGFGVPTAAPVHAGIEESFERRVAPLPRDARLLVLVAASEATGDAALVWRAAAASRDPGVGGLAAESSGLVMFRPGVTFRHPLVRSAVYRTAGAAERSEVHRALAEATDPERDPDRRAWHRAQAAVMPDEDVAADLERSASRAQARGGFAAAAAFLERSAALTSSPRDERRRALAAAQAKHQAGAIDEAVALLERAEVGPLDDFQRAQAEVLRARIAFATNRGSDAPPLLLAAARRLEPLDVPLARETYLDALTAALFTGGWPARRTRQVADAALAAPAGIRSTPGGPAPRRTRDARSPTGRRPERRRCGTAVAAFARRDVEPAEACGGGGWPVGRRDSSGTTRAGTAHGSPHPGGPRGGAARRTAARPQHARRRPPLRQATRRRRPRWSRRPTPSPGPPAVGVAPRYGALALAAHRGREDE